MTSNKRGGDGFGYYVICELIIRLTLAGRLTVFLSPSANVGGQLLYNGR
ncbi:hypothetical protein [Hyphomicrobium sp.]